MLTPNLLNQIATAKPLAERGARIAEGAHLLVLVSFEQKETEKGSIIAADFMSVESETYPEGVEISHAWFPAKGGWQGEKELSRCQAFVKALVGTEDSAVAGQNAVSMGEKSQPGRGLLIKATGVRKSEKYVKVQWSHVPAPHNGPDKVAERRATIELTLAKSPEPAPVTAPAPTPAPATGGGLLSQLK